MDKIELQEMISALADGQLRGEALERVIRTVATDAQARNAWHTYHLIGDVLRTGDLRTGTPPAAFLAGFQVRLEREQVDTAQVVAPVAASALNLPVASPRQFDPLREPANDGSFRWKLVAGFASLAAVAAVGWSTVGGIGRSDQPQLATVAPVAPGRPAVMLRDPGLDEMLAAHRQLGGASALQTPAGFLRNATFEAPAR
ncbi:MAG: sigma-E factor negative regulatory protein [Ramlibacter sp.]|nr:sigma-E factor negative regulatory protein [Ramlibacter sp.]